ncbi:hypothetical protein A9K55_007648 [Cordyceps militaris]|uniref:Uncharacterized protein n=1 Tax=Cordyceps militaris TaxID=73501 RepID=A0A2H4SKA1_CORMI|nr:hypothetical protein A9K55_007648 [Cordyceps militaris]
MPSQEQIPQQQPMAATNPEAGAARPSTEQPRLAEPMTVGLRGGGGGEGEAGHIANLILRRLSAAVFALASAALSAASAAARRTPPASIPPTCLYPSA